MDFTKQDMNGLTALDDVQDPRQSSLMLQISAETLATWKSQVENSYNQMKAVLLCKISNAQELGEDVSKLQDIVGQLLQFNTFKVQPILGATFPQFRRLPTEIRRIVWGHAFSEPQLFVIGDTACSRSHFNIIVDSCREAEIEAKLKLDFFTTRSREYGVPARQYINLHVDTVLLALRGTCIPKEIQMRCGYCSGPMCPQFCSESCPKFKRKSHCPIGKLAMPNVQWFSHYCPDDDLDPEGMALMEVLFQHHVKELFLVIGEIPPTPNQGVTLVEPTEAFTESDEGESWEGIAKVMMEEMKEYKNKLLSDEKSMKKRVFNRLQGMGRGYELHDVYSATLGFGPGEMGEYYDYLESNEPTPDAQESRLKYKDLADNIAEWEVPKIRFVEAKLKDNWVNYRESRRGYVS